MNTEKENLEKSDANQAEKRDGSIDEITAENSNATGEGSELAEDERVRPKRGFWVRKPALVAVSGILVIGLIAVGIWFLLFSNGTGESVPAPRNVSFSEGGDSSSAPPKGEQRITLTDAQLKSAKLEIVEIGETLQEAAASNATTGVVEANEYKETPVISLVGGVVRRINVDLGQFVRRGQTVAVISSEELAAAQSRHLSLRAEVGEVRNRYKRALTLSDVSEESRNELDKTTANLKSAVARNVEAKSNFERSKKLIEIGAISRRELEKTETAFEVSAANVEEAKKRLERAKRLLKINPARKNELDLFLSRLQKAEADLASSRERLIVLGLSARKVDALKSHKQINADLPIVSPVSGSVTERMVNRGEVISKNGAIAEVTDLSTVWVIGQVFERDLGKLRVRSGASITTDSYPGQLFRGNISYIDPNLDADTRTAQVRIEIPNPNQKLKIGMYVNVAYATLGGSEKTHPLVPKEAVQSIGSQKVLFEATDDPKSFILRPVRVAQQKSNAVAISEGIFVGDRVVTQGSFLLKAEWLKTNPATF
ncbi:MAG: efflux RND transporter periplasmic adaptor subunit [Pyrinomonadaceae bacterium]|nr:efflux RND transporter periplasmic adaptor subunit [Pyrinomonadaceae bacterium]